MSALDKMMRAMETGGRWDMARASYAYSRWHGLTRRDAFAGAWSLFWTWRK